MQETSLLMRRRKLWPLILVNPFPQAMLSSRLSMKLYWMMTWLDSTEASTLSMARLDGWLLLNLRPQVNAQYHWEIYWSSKKDARRAFPCWDEPAHKAVFEVTLTVPADRVALSSIWMCRLLSLALNAKICCPSLKPRTTPLTPRQSNLLLLPSWALTFWLSLWVCNCT